MNEVKIQWLGHSCFCMEYREYSIVTDPYEDGYVPGLAPLCLSAGAVYCSHGHGDHSAAACVKQTREKAPPDFSVQEFAALHGCDALLLPIGGYYTVDAEEAFAIAEKIAPRCIVPMHYRGEGFGFDELGTLDAFTALFAAEEVHFLKSDTFTLTAAEPRGVIVPQLENAEKTDGV